MNFELLKKLCETPAIPGRETQMRRLVANELRLVTDDVSVDTMGNVIGIKRGTGGPKVMLAAHMDEIGFFVREIDDKGFIRIHPVGGWFPHTMVAQRVHVHGFAGQTLLGAVMPAMKAFATNGEKKPLQVKDFVVDVGLSCEEVKELVEVGDMVTMARTTERVGNMVMSKALDDRVCIFAMIEALRTLKNHSCEIIAVATVQEEVGLRGATTAAYGLKPDIGIALDVTPALDYPGATDNGQISALKKGAALKIIDSSLISNPNLLRHLREVAKKHEITYQLEVLPFGGTDAGAIHRSRNGIPSIAISIPTRYIHSVNEMAAISDIEATITLLARYLEEAHTRSYGYEADITNLV